MNSKFITILILSLIVVCPYELLAHGTHGSGFSAGFTHPIFGIDHLLTIIGIGAVTFYTKKYLLMPVSFLLMMAISGYFGIAQEAIPAVETGIAISIVLIGVAVAYFDKVSDWLIAASIAIFGLLHGYAHGVEKPEGTTAIQYIPGYVLGALLVIAAAYALSLLLMKLSPQFDMHKVFGGLIVGIGLMIMLT